MYTKGKCRCEVDRYNILHRCPLHEAAPDMYEAIETALRNLAGRDCSDIEFDLRRAVAEVDNPSAL